MAMFADCTIVLILALFVGSVNSDCSCDPIAKKFNETFSDVVDSKCRKCYVFSYDFVLDQNWAPYLCVSSPLVSPHVPLLVVAREYLSVTSIQVPQIFEDRKKSYFTDVCRTLCPLANYFDYQLKGGKQEIFVEVTTRSVVSVEYEMKLLTVDDFIVAKDRPLTVNITPSQPRVVQYNMEHNLQAVRIEAESSDEQCMVLAIEDVQCPFSDSDSDRTGFFQTLMTKSGISVTKRTFSMGRMYIVLNLKTSNYICTASTEAYESVTETAQFRSKEVTLRIVPETTDVQYYLAIFVVLIPYALAYVAALCVCIWQGHNMKAFCAKDIEEGGSSTGSIRDPDPDASDAKTEGSAALSSMEPVIKKERLYLSDLTKKKDVVLSNRSKLYSWNLIPVAIFFAVPAFQLVFINQGIVNLTGNQDLCYYNFLCSYHLGYFSDFNHLYSNIGYVLLGVLFLLIVRRRELIDKAIANERRRNGKEEAVGIPTHFGLFYAMGAASIMEGVLSATYHVCPNKANFQFDTAMMYVIVTICMLRLYQARHPDITAKSHIIWVLLSLVILVNGGDVMITWRAFRIVYHIIFGLVYLVAVFLVSVKIYYMGCEKCNKGIRKHVYQNRKRGLRWGCCCYYNSEYKAQFFTFHAVMVVNIISMIYHYTHLGDFASFFLQVFIVNLLIYVSYYILMKKKRNLSLPAVYLILAIGTWIASIIYFTDNDTGWQLTPAESREINSRCYLLNFYDHHDVWHFLSSFAIFFSFMVLLTMDSDQQNQPRSQIEVF